MENISLAQTVFWLRFWGTLFNILLTFETTGLKEAEGWLCAKERGNSLHQAMQAKTNSGT